MGLDEIKTKQKENVIHNLKSLRAQSGLSVLEFCDNTFISHASYTRYINQDDPSIPAPSIIRDFCSYFRITPQQFLNDKLPDDFIKSHPDIFFTFSTTNEIDDKIIELLEHHFDIRLKQIIDAFLQFDIKIDFLPAQELTSACDTKEIEKQYYKTYTPERITRTIIHSFTYDDIKNDFVPATFKQSKQTYIAKQYIEYYLPTYILKYRLAKEIQITKTIPKIKVYAKRLSINQDNPDIYETISEMSLNQFFKYCDNYKKQILKTFHFDK